jgi:hypothetical protein
MKPGRPMALESVTRQQPVKKQQIEKIKCVLYLAIALEVLEVTNCRCSINPITNSNPFYIQFTHDNIIVHRYIVARQRLGKHIPATTNTYATITELFDASFSMRCLSYQRQVGD